MNEIYCSVSAGIMNQSHRLTHFWPKAEKNQFKELKALIECINIHLYTDIKRHSKWNRDIFSFLYDLIQQVNFLFFLLLQTNKKTTNTSLSLKCNGKRGYKETEMLFILRYYVSFYHHLLDSLYFIILLTH